MDQIKIFIAYAHKDKEFKDEIRDDVLKTIERMYSEVEVWHDRELEAGQRWDATIRKHLNESHLILLLVSLNFLGSDYIQDIEMKRAFEREEQGTARVIPIIISDCPWQHFEEFSKRHLLPEEGKPITDWPDRYKVLNNICEELIKVIESLRSGAAVSHSGPG